MMRYRARRGPDASARHRGLLLLLFSVVGLCTACPKTAEPEKASCCADAGAADATLAPAPEATIPADADKSASGLISKVLAQGSGERRPAAHDKVRVNFVSRKANGEVTDSSEKRGGPVVYEVTGVIAGWTEALLTMRVGEKRRLWIPDDLVYPGRAGYPRAMSIFDLELLEIIAGEPPAEAPPDLASPPRDAVKTGSGLVYKRLQKGSSSQKPRAWDRVSLHYTGWTSDGAMIDRSQRDKASLFDLAAVMPGWSEGLQLLSVGDRARFWIPEALAYQGQVGQPKGTLVFDVELVSVQRLAEPPRAPVPLEKPPANAKKTKSGLAYRIVKSGKGKVSPKPSDRVEVHYSAWTADGKLFDSSVLRGQSATVPVSRVIAGWAEGLTLMVEGDEALFWIPEELAYGKQGSPKGMLVYEVELIEILR